jgi:flagellar protein FlaG
MNVTTTNATPPGPAAEASARPKVPAASGNNVPQAGQGLPGERPAPAAPQVSIEKAIAQIQAFLRDSRRQLSFERDEASGHTVVRVIDPETGDVLRQFPPEELLKIAAIVEARGFRTFDEQA